jgi:hypothetical protein
MAGQDGQEFFKLLLNLLESKLARSSIPVCTHDCLFLPFLCQLTDVETASELLKSERLVCPVIRR